MRPQPSAGIMAAACWMMKSARALAGCALQAISAVGLFLLQPNAYAFYLNWPRPEASEGFK